MSGTIRLNVLLYSVLLSCGSFCFVEGSVECGAKQFMCKNGRCTNFAHVCDGDNDCGDDEKVCEPFQCHPSTVQCLDGRCISRRFICDGRYQCDDSSDEQMCAPFQCHPSSFQCSNGKCITRVKFCQGSRDCSDNSDERYCNIGENDVCPQGWSECPNNRSCLPSHWMCDGYPDCPDGGDEKNCGSAVCAPKQFKCANEKCIDMRYVCDGGNYCGDNSDEKVCDPFQCHPSTFQCRNGKCIPRRWICDGRDNCGDNSDEQTCAPFQCHPSSFQCSNGKCISRLNFCYRGDHCGDNSDERYCNIGEKDVCPQGWSECPNNRSCLPSHWMCDGYPDCYDGADEENCGSGECAPKQFKCANGKCIDMRYVCDGGNNCEDNSDEKDCHPFRCHPSTFQCLNGKCLSLRKVCDGRDHCGDNSDEDVCVPFQCHPSLFQCTNGKCIPRHLYCSGADECGDNSDDGYCNIGEKNFCPQGWAKCPNSQQCLPSHWVCDEYPDCQDGAEEKNCKKRDKNTPDHTDLKTELRSYLLSKRKPGFRTNRWGSQVHRIAVALHLSDNSTFIPGKKIGEEIRYELMMQLLYRLPRNTLSSQELAMYIQAQQVSCLDPRDFYLGDFMRELRRRVEATRNYTNPFLILVLCNAGDTMTTKDVQRVTAAYHSHQRPFWTDSQALSIMALSCIASSNSVLVDERTLMNLLQELKKRQFRNGTVDNFRTTALVSQALFIHDSYKKDFDLDSAIRVLVDGLKGSKSLMNAYYALPVLYGKSLLNVSSTHCTKQTVEEETVSELNSMTGWKNSEEEALRELLDVHGETITVQYSVWMGDEANVGRTWRLRMLVNSTIYDAIETAAKIDNRHKVQYNVVDGKPFVSSLNGKEDDPEMGTFWFVYLKAINSDEKPAIVEQSPVDIKVTPIHEIILWYKLAPWNAENSSPKLITSS